MTAANIPSRLIAAASIVAMLVHAFLGCCWHHSHPEDWHHAHAEESQDREQTASDSERHTHRPCERDRNTHSVVHSHPAPIDPHSPHEAPCDEPDCSYLASSAPERHAPVVTFEPSLLTSDIATRLSALAASLTGATPAAAAAQPLSTARVRAALQVWVV